MFDALGGDEFVRKMFDVGGFAADSEDFKAIVVVEMAVQRGDDHLAVLVLKVGQ